MKILLITNQKKEFFKINSYTDVVNYYIQTYFEKLNIEFDISPMKDRKTLSDSEIISFYKSLDISSYDYVLALGLRYFTTIPKECGEELKSRKQALIIQMYDGGMLDSAPVDFTLTARDDSDKYPVDAPANRNKRHHENNVYLGWAADKNLFLPRQFPFELRILVDHTIYDVSQPDRTMDILIKIRSFVKSRIWSDRYANVIVRMIVDNEVVTIDIDNISIKPYNRKGVAYIDMAKELNMTDIYFVTHGESVGLNALEAAMSGALVISPIGFMKKNLINSLYSYEFERTLDWVDILQKLDTKKSREIALKFDWEIIVKKMLNILQEKQVEK